MNVRSGTGRKIPRARIAAGVLGAGRFGILGSATGFKMFVVLMLALLPLGIVAVVGTAQTIHTTEIERIATLRLDSTDSASRLLAELNRDRSTLRFVANILERDRSRTEVCGRAKAQFRVDGRPVLFAVYDRQDRPYCQSAKLPSDLVHAHAAFFDQQATILPGTGVPDADLQGNDGPQKGSRLLVRVNSVDATMKAVASYDASQLAAMAGLSSTTRGFVDVALSRDAMTLPLIERGVRPAQAHIDMTRVPLNIGAIDLVMQTERPPVDLLRFAATLLPIFMWFAAAGVGWWVVNRFLIRPLVDLNRYVAAYEPGKILDPQSDQAGLAREIGMLADTFREVSQDVVEHEQQLADALVQQRALTREVHHRVKNNLQIIASLINLHARAAVSVEASAAYASIQRRVDALSVVHRNHYAAAELSNGIDAQALISELASALRASIPDSEPGFPIRVEGDNVYLSQDVAVPTAFLITELVELVMLSGHAGPVRIALRRLPDTDTAELSITSDALRPSPEIDQLLTESFGRVLTGLSRQLRATLDRATDIGRYAIIVNIRP